MQSMLCHCLLYIVGHDPINYPKHVRGKQASLSLSPYYHVQLDPDQFYINSNAFNLNMHDISIVNGHNLFKLLLRHGHVWGFQDPLLSLILFPHPSSHKTLGIGLCHLSFQLPYPRMSQYHMHHHGCLNGRIFNVIHVGNVNPIGFSRLKACIHS